MKLLTLILIAIGINALCLTREETQKTTLQQMVKNQQILLQVVSKKTILSQDRLK